MLVSTGYNVPTMAQDNSECLLCILKTKINVYTTLYVGVYKLVVTGASGSTTQQVVTVTVMSEGGEASEGVEGVNYAAIPVTEFGAYVADLHAGSNKKFKDLYKVMLY